MQLNDSSTHLSSTGSNRSSTSAYDSTFKESELCGFPAFCSQNAGNRCSNVTLADCGECNFVAAIAFGVVVFLLGLVIIFSNASVLWYCLRKRNRGSHDTIKASLAVADILSGFQPLPIALHNLSWTLNSTATELDRRQLELRGSTQSIIGGVFYLLGISSSLYHLVFLAQQRVFGIHWPIRYKMQDTRAVYFWLGIVWFAAISTSVIPSFFPNQLVFTYSQVIFLFNLTLAKVENPDYTLLAVLAVIMFLLPFVLMTGLTVASAVLVRRYVVHSTKKLGPKHEAVQSGRSVIILKTVAFMQVGFTLTLLPTVIVTLLESSNVLTCNNKATPYVICFYLSQSNSLVNVMIYMIRDKKYRKLLGECFAFKRKRNNTCDASGLKLQPPTTARTNCSGIVV